MRPASFRHDTSEKKRQALWDHLHEEYAITLKNHMFEETREKILDSFPLNLWLKSDYKVQIPTGKIKKIHGREVVKDILLMHDGTMLRIETKATYRSVYRDAVVEYLYDRQLSFRLQWYVSYDELEHYLDQTVTGMAQHWKDAYRTYLPHHLHSERNRRIWEEGFLPIRTGETGFVKSKETDAQIVYYLTDDLKSLCGDEIDSITKEFMETCDEKYQKKIRELYNNMRRHRSITGRIYDKRRRWENRWT